MQVLPQRQEINAAIKQVGKYIQQFVTSFSKAKHEAAFRSHSRQNPLGIGQELERPWIVAFTAPHVTVEAGDRFGIVVEHIWLRLHESLQGAGLVYEVGHEHLDYGTSSRSHGVDGATEVVSTAVG